MTQITITPEITIDDQRDLVKNLGIDRPAEERDVTMQELSGAMEARSNPAFASMGEAIRRDLSGRLDDGLLETERENVATQIGRLPDVRDTGVPNEPEGLYESVAKPGWRVYDHLIDVGFFDALEAHLSRFTPEHIAHTARELLLADPLQSTLDDVGFDDREQTALLMSVVNNNTRLARWVPTSEIPADNVEFDVSFVPPLHQRALGGALLWIRDLDRHLWQNEVLITDEILDATAWNVKAMLGGAYVVTLAAHDIAAERTLTDGQLTAALTAGAAIAIIGQEELMKDAYYITDDKRAPSALR